MPTIWDQTRINRPSNDLASHHGTHDARDLTPPQAHAQSRLSAWDRAMATKQKYEQDPSSVPPPVVKSPGFLSRAMGWLGVAALPIGVTCAGYMFLAYVGALQDNFEQKNMKLTLAEKSEKGPDKKWARKREQMKKDFQHGGLSYIGNKALGRDPSAGPILYDTLEKPSRGKLNMSMPNNRSFEYNDTDTWIVDGPRGNKIRSSSVNDKNAPSMVNEAYEQVEPNSTSGQNIHVSARRGGR